MGSIVVATAVVAATLGWPRRLPPYCHIVSAAMAVIAGGVGSAALFTWGTTPV